MHSLRIIGCTSYVRITECIKSKLVPRALLCVLIGYDAHTKGYRCFHPPTCQIFVSSNIKFDESRLYYHHLSSPPPHSPPKTLIFPDPPISSPSSFPPRSSPPPASASFDLPLLSVPSPAPSLPVVSSSLPLTIYRCRSHPIAPGDPALTPPPLRQRPQLLTRLPAYLQDCKLHTIENIFEPTSFDEAFSHPGWQATMISEYQSIIRNHTWKLCALPPNRKAITTKWVYKVKAHADGSPAKLKARLVAHGFQQRKGFDYDDTFALVAKWNTFRCLLALVGHRNSPIFHLDVKSAFLNG